MSNLAKCNEPALARSPLFRGSCGFRTGLFWLSPGASPGLTLILLQHLFPREN